jgi:hypothetical protein
LDASSTECDGEENHDEDGIQVRPVYHCHPAPINWPPVYEENLNDDENFIIEGLFEHNGGAGRGACRVWRHQMWWHKVWRIWAQLGLGIG